MRTRKTQNIKINMTCGSEFRLKKLYLFLHIFLTFSRENSRLGTSPPMMENVWSHLKWHCTLVHASYFIILLCLMPDNFSCQRDSAANQWVKKGNITDSEHQPPKTYIQHQGRTNNNYMQCRGNIDIVSVC